MTPLAHVDQPPDFIKLLANDVRWGVLKALVSGDHQVNELVTLLDQPMNLVSYHLKKMREEMLVTTRRSEADGRDIYYTLDLERLRDLYLAAGGALHPLLSEPRRVLDLDHLPAARVLVVCTHNSARSQMAQALLRDLSQGNIAAFSAGSHPTQVHPDAIQTMDSFGIDIRAQSVHHVSEYEGQPFDYVITVCDKARENCPTFPGAGQQLHWGYPDPLAITNAEQRQAAFRQIAQRLRIRIEHFLVTLAQS